MNDKQLTPEEAYIKKGNHLFYKLENGKVTSVNTEKRWIRMAACVPSIYTNELKVISKTDFDEAYQFALK